MHRTLIAAMVLALVPGSVLADSGSASKPPRKIPGMHKVGDVTLKRGVMSAESASELLKALKPLEQRPDTRAMRNAEVQYAEELQAWAAKQKGRLQELRKIRSRYNRLKSYRDQAAARGDTTSRIDPRLKHMRHKMEVLSGEIRLAHDDLRSLQRRLRQTLQTMSAASKLRHRTADDYLAKLGE